MDNVSLTVSVQCARRIAIGAGSLSIFLCGFWSGFANAFTAGENVELGSLGTGTEVVTASGYNPITSDLGRGRLFSNTNGVLQGELVGIFNTNYSYTGSVNINTSLPRPSVTAVSDFSYGSSDTQISHTHAQGRLDYSFTVVGPANNNVLVPVFIQGTVAMFVDHIPGGASFARTDLYLPTGARHDWFSFNPSPAPFSFIELLHVGGPYSLGIEAYAAHDRLIGNIFGDSFATATIDPYISIDPTFADASKYHIVVESGINNSPVPVPSAIWLLGPAFGSLGLVRRRTA